MENNLLDLNQMSNQDKKAYLQNAYNLFFQQKGKEIINKGLEIVDFGYNIGNGNSIVYTLVVRDKDGNTKTRFFDDGFNDIKIDSDELEALKAAGSDTSEIEKNLGIDEDSEHTSIKDLEKEEPEQQQGQGGINQDLSQAIDNTAKTTGVSKEQIVQSIQEQDPNKVLTDDKKNVMLNINDIPGTRYSKIDVSQKISVNDTLRDYIGGDYVSIQPIVTQGKEIHIFGIDKDGNAQEIGSDKIELYTDAKPISLMQVNGETKQVQPDFVIGIRSQGTDTSKRIYLGGYEESTGENSMFVARRTPDDNMIATELPSRTNSENQHTQDIIMDPTRTSDVSILDTVNDIAEKYGIEDPNDLLHEVIETYGENLDEIKEEDIVNVAEWLQREPGERVLGEEEHRPPIN